MTLGLREVGTDHLKLLLRMVHQGTLECPFQKFTLMGMGLEHVAHSASILCGLDERGVRAVLVSVLAERMP